MFSAGDLVFLGPDFAVAFVISCCGVAEGGELFVAGQQCSLVHRHSASSATWRPDSALSLVHLLGRRLLHAYAWTIVVDGDIMALQAHL